MVGADALGPDQPYQPDAYRIAAVPAQPSDGRTLTWPSDVDVRLADTDPRDDGELTLCGVVAADELNSLLENAKSNDVFDDGGVIYRIGIRPAIPTDHPCASELPEGGESAPATESKLVLKLYVGGGFAPPEVEASTVPQLLITSDGTVLSPGLTTRQFPGVLPTPMIIRKLNPVALAKVMAAAKQAGLLAPSPGYPETRQVEDVATTTLTISDGTQTYVHSAYALGYDGTIETSAERRRLQQFVDQLIDLTGLVGDDALGEPSDYRASEYRVQAFTTKATADDRANAKTWPLITGVSLADIADRRETCAIVPAAQIDPILEGSTTGTVFIDGDKEYHLAVRASLPGDKPCS